MPGAVNAALKDIAFGANAYVINVGNRLTNYIVLKANFFTLASAADQKITLFHELLHYAYQKNDIDLARLFGIYDPKNPGGSSARISEWLKADCDKSKLQ